MKERIAEEKTFKVRMLAGYSLHRSTFEKGMGSFSCRKLRICFRK